MLIGLYWNSEDISRDFVYAKGERDVLTKYTVINWPISMRIGKTEEITVTGRFPFLVSLILRKRTWFLNELRIVRVFI